MRKSTHEVNQRPPELHENGAPEFVENPSEFHENSAPEFVPLPDEFNRNAPVVEPEKRKTSTLQKIMLYLAAAGLVILGVITPVVRVNPPEEEPAVAAAETPQPVKATVTPSAVPPASTPKPNTPSPEPTAEPTETPVPLLTGTIHIVVYSEILDMERARAGKYPSAILAEETLDAATFTEYVLPPLPKKDGYNALGCLSANEAYDAMYGGTVFDLIISDIMIPEVGGFEFARTIRGTDKTSQSCS